MREVSLIVYANSVLVLVLVLDPVPVLFNYPLFAPPCYCVSELPTS